MKRFLQWTITATFMLGLVAGFGSSGFADDESDEVAISLEAPLEQVDCAAMTVTVLGLAIDIRSARISSNADDDDDGDDDEQSDRFAQDTVGCDALVAGRNVEIELLSDTTLVASEVEQEEGDGDDHEVQIVAPLQEVDLLTSTVQVLGLSIDIGSAEFEGSEDDSEQDSELPVSISNLMVGQFVEIELESTQFPLRASELRILNFANQVLITVVGPNGQPIAAGTLNGIAPDEFRVDVIQKVRVLKQTKNGSRPSVRQLRFRSTGSDTIMLSGLPTGRAKIIVTRSNQPSNRGKARVEIVANATQQIQLRLQRYSGP